MNKKTLTKFGVIETEQAVLNYKKAKNFFHCKRCIESFIESPLYESMTIREYGIYEVSNYLFVYPDGEKAEIIVVWCKRCLKPIWDSRNLSPIY